MSAAKQMLFRQMFEDQEEEYEEEYEEEEEEYEEYIDEDYIDEDQLVEEQEINRQIAEWEKKHPPVPISESPHYEVCTRNTELLIKRIKKAEEERLWLHQQKLTLLYGKE